MARSVRTVLPANDFFPPDLYDNESVFGGHRKNVHIFLLSFVFCRRQNLVFGAFENDILRTREREKEIDSVKKGKGVLLRVTRG